MIALLSSHFCMFQLNVLNWIWDIQRNVFLNTCWKSALTEQMGWCHLTCNSFVFLQHWNYFHTVLFVDTEISISDFTSFIVILSNWLEKMVHYFFCLHSFYRRRFIWSTPFSKQIILCLDWILCRGNWYIKPWLLFL